MDIESQHSLPRRALLRGAALTALTTVTLLGAGQSHRAHAAATPQRPPRRPEPLPPGLPESHPPYEAIVGLL